MAFAVAASLAIACAVCYGILQLMMYYTRRQRLYKLASKFPGPPVLPFIGNAHQLFGSAEHSLNKMNELATKYPSPCRVWLGPYLLMFISKAEQVKEVCLSSKTLGKGPVMDFYTPLTGTGLFTAPLAKWKVHRKLIQPTFNTKILNTFVEVFAAQAKLFCKNIEGDLDGSEYEIFQLVSLCTLDMICETAMDVKVGAQINQNVKFVEAEEKTLASLTKRFFTIWLYPDMFFYRTELGRDQRKNVKYMLDFTDNVLKNKKNKISKCPSPGATTENKDEADDLKPRSKALLDHLLTLPQEVKTLSDIELRDEVITFIVTGHETSATEISYALLMLATYPEVQEKACQELYEIYGDDDIEERPVTAEDLPHLKYLERVIKETLRHFPVVPFILREVADDLNIGDCSLPRGCGVVTAVMPLHRNEKYWPDPFKFDPDRFLPEETAKRHPYAYMPFGAGPRNCVGLVYAQMVMKTLIATILRRYLLKTDNPKPPQDVGVKFASLLVPTDPIKLRLFRRIRNNS